MDFDAESSSTEAAAASRTVNEAAVGVPQNVADNAAARDEEAEKEGELHNKSDVSTSTKPIWDQLLREGLREGFYFIFLNLSSYPSITWEFYLPFSNISRLMDTLYSIG